MKTIFQQIKYVLILTLVTGLGLVTSCSEDDAYELGQGTGMVQFRIYKEGLLTKKATTTLDNLYEAKKIRVALRDESNNVFMQSLALEAYDEETAEYGLTSEKLALLAGNYELLSYTLYNAKNEEIQANELEVSTQFTVLTGGLSKHIIAVDAAVRGKVQFYLKKDIVMTTKATSADGEEDAFPFRALRQADIVVKNLETNRQIELEDIDLIYLEDFDGTEAGSAIYGFAQFDSIVSLPAGTYSVVEYQLSNSSGSTVYTQSDELADNEFTVSGYELVQADVPVRISAMAAHVKDYIALHAIWEALDGENWSFAGDAYARGTNWDFNKDIDMWGEQPGVSMSSSGRVIGLTIGGFGPRGVVPDEIGQLTELTTLILGEINDMNGNFESTTAGASNQNYYVDGQSSDSRLNDRYFENYVQTNPLAHFSEISQRAIALEKNTAFKLADITIPSLTPKVGTLTNHITGISDELKNLKKLVNFSIANSPISEIPDVLDQLPELTDVQVANCPNLTTFPDVLTRLDKLVALNVALNLQMSGDELFRGLDKMAVFEGQKEKKTIQLLYLSYNNLTTLPASFSNLERLGGMDCIHNKIEVLPALGMNVSPVQLLFSNNNIHTIETDANGNYCNMDDMETFIASDNQLTEYPDIFDAESIYKMGTIDLSYNKIGNIGENKGLNADILVLVGNELTEFPANIFNAGSTITFLNVANNKISRFPEDSFDGKYVYAMTTLDMSYNYLTEIPYDFNNLTLPYLTGLDLSHNRFANFPYRPLNIANLTIFGVRYQRDADGYRSLKEWPASIYQHKGLRALWMGGNDFGKVPSNEIIGPYLNMLDVSDNPNLVLDVSNVSDRIANGTFLLIYDPTQEITGSSNLDLE